MYTNWQIIKCTCGYPPNAPILIATQGVKNTTVGEYHEKILVFAMWFVWKFVSTRSIVSNFISQLIGLYVLHKPANEGICKDNVKGQ